MNGIGVAELIERSNQLSAAQRKEIGMLPFTVSRVPSHADAAINERIRRQTEQNSALFRNAGSAAITQRLQELEEWDIERTLEANAATVDRRWTIAPRSVAATQNTSSFFSPSIHDGARLIV